MDAKKKYNHFLLGNRQISFSSHFQTPIQPNTHYPKLKPFIINHKKEISHSNQKLLTQKGIDKKILIIYACHTNNDLKKKSFDNNFRYLSQVPNSDLVIVNSNDLLVAHQLEKAYKSKCKNYLLVKNDKFLDFGKWKYVLDKIDYSSYKYITFVNDSIIIESPINYYFNLLRTKNFDLYGYNNSTQTRFHTQSYLFSIKSAMIHKFLNYFEKNKGKINNNQDSVVHTFEVKLTDIYPNHKNFINTRVFPDHKGKNIFFNNDYLYHTLKRNGLFPFTKIKRLRI